MWLPARWKPKVDQELPVGKREATFLADVIQHVDALEYGHLETTVHRGDSHSGSTGTRRRSSGPEHSRDADVPCTHGNAGSALGGGVPGPALGEFSTSPSRQRPGLLQSRARVPDSECSPRNPRFLVLVLAGAKTMDCGDGNHVDLGSDRNHERDRPYRLGFAARKLRTWLVDGTISPASRTHAGPSDGAIESTGLRSTTGVP